MADIKLVSIGDDIKLWDSNYLMCKQTNPHAHNVSSISWSHDRNLLASTSQHNDKIALIFVASSTTTPQIPIENKAGGMCVSFNSNSRYLLLGRTDKAISIYDCKKKLYMKTYKDHKGAVTSAQFNWNDTYIASGSESGEIILYNVITGQSCTPLVAPNAQAVRQVQYSYYEKSALASASDDGTVCLWDTGSRRLVHSFNKSHQAPASGVAFSPLNALLLCSAGLDKRLFMYDLRAKSVMSSINTESPLTSIDMLNDGSTVAVGSTRGKIYVYDMRQGRSPIKIFSAHRSSVQSIKFKNVMEDSSISRSGNRSLEKKMGVSSGHTRHLPTAPAAEQFPVTPHPQLQGESFRRDYSDGNTTEDIFSPVRNNESGEISGLSESNATSLGMTTGGDGFFSPLGDNNSHLKISRRMTGVEASYITSPLAGNLQISASKAGSFTLPESHITLPENVSSEGGRGSAVLEAAPVISQTLSGNLQRPSLIVSSPDISSGRTVPSPRSRAVSASPSLPLVEHMQVDKEQESQRNPGEGFIPRNIDFDEQFPGTPPRLNGTTRTSSNCSGQDRDLATLSARDGRPTGTGDHHTEDHLSSGMVTSDHTQQPQAFQEKLLRSVVKEAVEEVRDQLHRDTLNLHVEMIRQFQIQLVEMNAMMSQYCGNVELVEEVKRLRAENERLKRFF